MPYRDKTQQKEAQRRHYLANKSKYRATSNKHREARLAWFATIRASKQCKVCGQNDWRCLDFHHRYPVEKFKEVTVMAKEAHSETAILAEIVKCDVLGANCHNRYHYKTDRRCSGNVGILRAYKEAAQCANCGLQDAACL